MPTLQAGLPSNTPRHITPHQQAVYCQLRHATAIAGGLEAIATQALDAGEACPTQLDYIVELSSHLTENLRQLSGLFAEVVAG